MVVVRDGDISEQENRGVSKKMGESWTEKWEQLERAGVFLFFQEEDIKEKWRRRVQKRIAAQVFFL